MPFATWTLPKSRRPQPARAVRPGRVPVGLQRQDPLKAVFVEKVKDCQFSFLANAYSNLDQFLWAFDSDKSEVGAKIGTLAQGRVKPEIVDTAPCKEVIVKGKDVDLTILPWFLHHDRDGHGFIEDLEYISADPDTGVPDWGIYRSMFRTKNEINIDMTCETHRCRLNTFAWRAKGKDMPVSIVIGGPIIDKLASLSGGAGNPDDWEVLGSFYGAPAKMVKSETNDLLVPTNSEIVLECRIITTEGWVHDEGPYGEDSGMYGGGLKHNCRVIIDCITYKKGGIYQHASIGGSDATHTDMGISLAGCAGAMMHGLKGAGLDVLEVRADSPMGETADAKIRAHSGDAQRALYVMLTCSGQTVPKIAMVFDEDVDIWNDAQIRQAQAFRFDAARDAVILSAQPGTAIDPMTGRDEPSFICSKLGMDCTIPWGDGWVRDKFTFALCTTGLGEPDPKARQMTEDEIAADMEAFIREQPRAWKDIARYLAQPYPLVYRAFGRLRPRLGRVDSSPWYPYTFSSHEFDAVPEPAPQDNFDPRHPKA